MSQYNASIAGVDAVLTEDGDVVGRVVKLDDNTALIDIHYHDQEKLAGVLAGANLHAEKEYHWTKECDLEDHRPCELAVAVGMAAGISLEEGKSIPPKLQEILDTEILTESRAKDALTEWAQTVDEQYREQADAILSWVENPTYDD
jgi:hypothetical protein